MGIRIAVFSRDLSGSGLSDHIDVIQLIAMSRTIILRYDTGHQIPHIFAGLCADRLTDLFRRP